MTTWNLRDYQQDAYETADGQSRVIVNMPTGWGKSFLLCALAASDLRNPSRKVVICVPQRIIAKGFSQKKKIILPDGEIVEWSVPRNLCGTSTAKVDELTDFLLAGPAKSAARRVVLTTHMTLSYALNRLSDDELAEVADETTYVIDESHHISASEQNRNVLGEQIVRILDTGSEGLKMWLATAYFFRGDHLPIISETHLSEFTRVHVPFDEYWQILKHIKSYSYDFVAYKGTVFKELQHLLQQSATPTIIYCPPEGHKMLLGKSKAKFVARLQQTVCDCLDATPWTSFDEALRQEAVVVDLVVTEQRTEKIRFVAEHGNRVAAILTVGMFREGADWVEAARIIDLVPTNSDQDRLQRFGRLVRDCRGKRHISYFNLFPLVVEQNEEERRRQLTKLYAHFHASLVLENAVEPVRVRLRPRPKHGPKEEAGDPKSHFNLLGEFSEAEQEQIIRDTYESLLK
ncbi:DEAD/DEAH box helicase [Fuerstiella marisgermanici]|uniref:UvsW helicase n=1 Tax=Fuerstiella marisgermanici TaxID=1891926 RepID=A0A1P8W903_9PLAN|nr:DEAD/DEAH box helicase family protein [Fuerstiella marisgermanici]APZ90546.1 UvsW helicase [Fuerstiella marisgermanici]